MEAFLLIELRVSVGMRRLILINLTPLQPRQTLWLHALQGAGCGPDEFAEKCFNKCIIGRLSGEHTHTHTHTHRQSERECGVLPELQTLDNEPFHPSHIRYLRGQVVAVLCILKLRSHQKPSDFSRRSKRVSLLARPFAVFSP